MPSRSAGRSFFASPGWRDRANPARCQKCRRTAARVSAKVGRCLRYQAAVRTADRAPSGELCGEQGHEGEQPEQAGRGARDGPVRPLALGLDAEMVADLAEGDLHLPALDEPAQDLQRVLVGIGAEQGLRVEAAPGVAQQHPADRHDRQPGVAPDGGAGADLDDALALRRTSPAPGPAAQRVPASARTSARFGRRAPLVRGRPTVPGRRGGAGSYRAASSRRRVTQTSPCRASAARKSRAAKLLSPTSTSSRPAASGVLAGPSAAPSRSASCAAGRARGSSAPKGPARSGTASAQTRPAQGIGTSSIRLSQRRPQALTKCPWQERTGSR